MEYNVDDMLIVNINGRLTDCQVTRIDSYGMYRVRIMNSQIEAYIHDRQIVSLKKWQ